MHLTIAYAIIHGTLDVYVAENNEVLNEVLVREVISKLPSTEFETSALAEVRQALLGRRWDRAVEILARETNIAVDIFDSGTLWTEGSLNNPSTDVILQESAIFKDSNV